MHVLCRRVQNDIAQSGAIAGLVSVLDKGSTQAQANAIEALRNLSVDAASCRQISQAPQVRGDALLWVSDNLFVCSRSFSMSVVTQSCKKSSSASHLAM